VGADCNEPFAMSNKILDKVLLFVQTYNRRPLVPLCKGGLVGFR